MCKCTPSIRSMYCGSIGCEFPDSWKSRKEKQQLINSKINESCIRPLETVAKLYRDDLDSGRKSFSSGDINLLVAAIENLFKVD